MVNNLFGQGQAANKENSSKSSKANAFDLTNKELQVLKLILSGYTNKEISEQLQNSKRTIETHRFNLMRKMEVKNLIELSKKAREAGLI